jgi:hypothetical protein
MEPEGSLPYSQKPATGPYSEPAESSSPHSIPVSLRFILMLSSHIRLDLPSGIFPSGVPHACYKFHPLILPDLITLTIFS